MLNMDKGAMDEINMDFIKEDINGVLVFRTSICTGGIEQLFLVTSSSLPLPLPFPDSAAGPSAPLPSGSVLPTAGGSTDCSGKSV